MYALIFWSTQMTNVVPVKCLKYSKNGEVTATLNGKDFYSTCVLLKNKNKKYLENLIVTTDGSVYSAKGRKLIRNFSSQLSKTVEMTSEIISSSKTYVTSEIPGCSGWSVYSFSSGSRGRSISTDRWVSSDTDSSDNDDIPVKTNDVAEIVDTAPADTTQSDKSIVSLEEDNNNTIVSTVQNLNTTMMELIIDSGIFVNTEYLQLHLRHYKNQSSELAFHLMFLIVGEENLNNMTVAGRRPYQPIPKNTYDTVQKFVSLNASPPMSSEEFKATIECLCRDVKQLYRLKKRFEISDICRADNAKSDMSVISLEDDNNNTIVTTVQDANTGKTELIPGSRVYIKTKKLDHFMLKYKKKSSKLAIRLMRNIVGEENLINMTPTGRGQYRKIPKIVYDTIEDYVSQKASPQMTSEKFQEKMKFLCLSIRKATELKMSRTKKKKFR